MSDTSGAGHRVPCSQGAVGLRVIRCPLWRDSPSAPDAGRGGGEPIRSYGCGPCHRLEMASRTGSLIMVTSTGWMRPSAADCQPPGSRATPSSYACFGTADGRYACGRRSRHRELRPAQPVNGPPNCCPGFERCAAPAAALRWRRPPPAPSMARWCCWRPPVPAGRAARTSGAGPNGRSSTICPTTTVRTIAGASHLIPNSYPEVVVALIIQALRE